VFISELHDFFAPKNVVAAVKLCNFNEGVGAEMFNGALLKDETILAPACQHLFNEALNFNQIPLHLKEGRLIPFSKSGKSGAAL